MAMATAFRAMAAPGDFQRFRGTLFGEGGLGSVARTGPVGFSVNFSLPSNLASRSGALFEKYPFATLFADIYLDRHVAVRPFVAAACPPEQIKALNPALRTINTCAAATQLGRGMASGYARNVGASPGDYLRSVDLQVRAFRGPGRDSFLLYVYSELSKENLVEARVSKVTGPAPYATRIRFTIPRGLIAPSPTVISQLSGFQLRLPANAAASRGVFRLDRCPANRKVKMAFRADYNSNLATGGPLTNADGFSITDSSPMLGAVSRCR